LNIRSAKGLTFDDVLLVPRRSSIASRKDVDTTSFLTPTIRLRIPIVSANMDTVTEAGMAIAMARVGGIGVIHRFMTTEQQVQQVQRVKRAEGFVVENPYAIAPNASVDAARRLMKRHDVGGLVVLDSASALVGLITRRDILLAPDALRLVNEVMTPRDRLVTAKADITPEQAQALLYQHRLEKLPVVE